MGRRRTRDRHLPARVYRHRNWYRYVPRDGKPIPLARIEDYAGMLRALADLLGESPPIRTISGLLDRYGLEVLPEKAESTRKDQTRQLENLRKTFGHMIPSDLRQSHAAQYMHKRAATAPTAAVHEVQLLSHVCTKAVEWDVMTVNPLRGMRKISRPPRQRYVTDQEFEYVLSLASPMVQAVMKLAILTGLRRGDIFALRKTDYTADGLLVTPSKTKGSTGVQLLFELTDELVEVIEQAIALPPKSRPFIVGNRAGNQYTKDGFDSVWQRLMSKATDPDSDQSIERFQFRDLRRKSASDEEDEQIAQQRLGHASVAITNRVYRVLPKKVKPLR